MWNVTEEDFKIIDNWGLKDDPFRAVSEYNDLRKELRWLNKDHRNAWEKYIYARLEYIGNKDFDDYYKKAEKPIDKLRWEFLMKRKAWYIMPLGWDTIAKDSCKVSDLGCGDGDTVQRLIDYIDEYWKKNNINDKKIEIIGIDLNDSRIDNAKKLVESPNSNIKYDFYQADAIEDGLDYENNYFDYSLCTGVLEILDDEQCEKLTSEMCRTTKSGIYVEDLYERFPGGFPRELPELFKTYNFHEKQKKVVFSEPFSLDGLSDPKALWPIFIDQNVWLEKKI